MSGAVLAHPQSAVFSLSLRSLSLSSLDRRAANNEERSSQSSAVHFTVQICTA